VTTGSRSYDDRMAWGAENKPLADHDVDLSDPAAPDELFARLAEDEPVTALVMGHCESAWTRTSSPAAESPPT
jgi:hypothetical protein